MPTLKSLIVDKGSRDSVTGEILSNQGNGLYMVKAAGIDRVVRSAVADVFEVGSRVVLSLTDEGTYIVGKEKIRQRLRKEVRVDG